MRRRGRLAGFLAACAAALGLQAAPAHADELAFLVEPQAHFEKIAYGFRYVERPVWYPRGWLLFSDIPANTVYQCAATDLDIALARGLASRTRTSGNG